MLKYFRKFCALNFQLVSIFQPCIRYFLFGYSLTLFDMGGHDGPQDNFDHCDQTLRRRKLKLGDF